MNILMYIVSGTVEIFLCLLSFAIVLRILLPLIGTEGGLLYSASVALSEPVVAPIRGLLSKSEFFESFPMDLSYVITIGGILLIYTFFPSASAFL